MKRREFLKSTVAAAGLGAGVSRAGKPDKPGQLALLGGRPVRTTPFPSWPVVGDNDRKGVLEVLESGKWFRGWGKMVEQFEENYARLMGAKYCIATANGTGALFTSLRALGIGPGSEVIVPPYTFMATVNVVFLHYALPVFVDTDIETSQIDAHKIESAISSQTACILPVHMGGNAADMDTILTVANRHKLPVLEDACQAHFAEWRGRKLSTIGTLGCFSFQNSKNLNSGEGGAILTSDLELAAKCYGFHNCGRKRYAAAPHYASNSTNLRMTEFQARLLMEQLTRVEEQSRLRERNAAYLSELLRDIRGITPPGRYEGCTRNAHHVYMARYDRRAFEYLPRETFLKALRAEGIPCSGGYSPLNKQDFVINTISSPAYKKIYSPQRIKRYLEENHCPVNDRLCQEALWFGQTTLLADRQAMEQIAEAIRKIQARAAELKKA